LRDFAAIGTRSFSDYVTEGSGKVTAGSLADFYHRFRRQNQSLTLDEVYKGIYLRRVLKRLLPDAAAWMKQAGFYQKGEFAFQLICNNGLWNFVDMLVLNLNLNAAPNSTSYADTHRYFSPALIKHLLAKGVPEQFVTGDNRILTAGLIPKVAEAARSYGYKKSEEAEDYGESYADAWEDEDERAEDNIIFENMAKASVEAALVRLAREAPGLGKTETSKALLSAKLKRERVDVTVRLAGLLAENEETAPTENDLQTWDGLDTRASKAGSAKLKLLIRQRVHREEKNDPGFKKAFENWHKAEKTADTDFEAELEIREARGETVGLFRLCLFNAQRDIDKMENKFRALSMVKTAISLAYTASELETRVGAVEGLLRAGDQILDEINKKEEKFGKKLEELQEAFRLVRVEFGKNSPIPVKLFAALATLLNRIDLLQQTISSFEAEVSKSWLAN
jgi:hypothetical protein